MAGELVRKTTTSFPDRRFWSGQVEYNTRMSAVYSIGIIDLIDIEWWSFSKVNPTTKTSGDQALYQFTTPPQSIEVTEPAATTIIPTQGGGKFVESQGNLFKDIRIAGTVGFRPNVPSKELLPGLGKAGGPSFSTPTSFLPDFLTKDNRGLDPKEVTGFDEMMFLRNIFRAYFDLKGSVLASRIGLLWIYSKEAEAYVVEPTSFTTSRDRGNPLGWNYNIQLRSLYKFDATFFPPPNGVDLWTALNQLNPLTLLNKMANSIAKAMTMVADLIDYVANLPANLLQSIFSSFTTVLRGISSVRNSYNNFSKTVDESLLRTSKSAVAEMRSLLDDKYGAGGDPSKVLEGDIGSIRHSFIVLEKAAEAMLTADGLWKEDKNIQVSDYSQAYLSETGETPLTSGSLLNPANITLPDSAVEKEIHGGDTIRTLALDYLGDEAAWKKLAIMNNLKPPYISANGGDGVLKPGDTILVPQRAASSATLSVSRTVNPDAASEAQRPMMKRYGRDLRLLEVGGELADFAVTSGGDIDVVEGVDNVIQAIKIKFATEQGDLPTHSYFGAKYPVGTKLKMTTVHEFALHTRRTFFQDPRIEEIVSMDIYASGDQLFTKSHLKLIGADAQIPFTFSVRR